jgi:hypothetical protein
MHISKGGDPYLRTMLAQGTHHILGRMEREVDNQVAALAETRTPNLHRATIAHRRVQMEGLIY